MNWPQAYIIAERPSGLATSASPTPTTRLLMVRGLGPPSGVAMLSAKCAGPSRPNAVPVPLRSVSVVLLSDPSIDR